MTGFFSKIILQIRKWLRSWVSVFIFCLFCFSYTQAWAWSDNATRFVGQVVADNLTETARNKVAQLMHAYQSEVFPLEGPVQNYGLWAKSFNGWCSVASGVWQQDRLMDCDLWETRPVRLVYSLPAKVKLSSKRKDLLWITSRALSVLKDQSVSEFDRAVALLFFMRFVVYPHNSLFFLYPFAKDDCL